MAQTVAPPMQSAATAGSDSSRAALQDRLQLTAPQLPYWARFEARLDAYSKLFYEETPIAAFAGEPAPRQFARLTDSLQNRLAALEDIERGAKDLYAVLSVDQQKIATQLLLASVPTFATACVPTDSKARTRDTPQRSRRGSAMGGSGGQNPILN